MKGTLFKKLTGKTIQCLACSRYCTIKEGDTGFCGVRKNIGGKLELLVYGRPCAVWVDPIEKKPLFHFLPGTKSYSIGTFGCNFACEFCFTPENTVINDDSVKTLEELFDESENSIELQNGTVGLVKDKHTYSASGIKRGISKVFRHPYSGKVLTIRPRHVPPLTCTPEHRFFVYKNGTIGKVMARELRKNDYLIIPKIRPGDNIIITDTKQILEKNVSKIKKMRKLNETGLRLLLKLKEAGKTSREIGKVLKMHPAYLRKLMSELRKNGIREETFYYDNRIVEKKGRIKFKMEKGIGIPRKIKVDENFAELLGYYCAEGHVHKFKDRPSSYHVVFSYGKHEKELIERTKYLIKTIFGINATIFFRRTTTCVEVGNASLGEFLSQLCGKGSHEKTVPYIISKSNAAIIKSFLNAFIKGDGCILKDKIAINTVSKKLALGIYHLFLLSGYLPSFYTWHPPKTKKIEGRTVNQSTLYYVKLQAEKFREWFLGNSKFVPKTKSEENIKFKETKKYWLVPVFKIEENEYSGFVYNCEVEEEHSYLANFVGVCNCQNWDISQAPKEFFERFQSMISQCKELPPELAVKEALASGCKSISYTYNEPTIFSEYAHDIGVLARKKGLKNVYVTNGYESRECWEYVSEFLDAVNIDLKGPEKFYEKLCHATMPPVKASIKKAYDLGIWVEVTTLLIEGENDGKKFLRETAEYIYSIDPEMPWHLTAFFPHYKMKNKPATKIETLIKAREIAKEVGLKYIYCGNVISQYENTICPKCKKEIIKRVGFSIEENNLIKGKCNYCGYKIKGVFE